MYAIQVDCTCGLCKKTQTVTVPREGYLRWRNGNGLIQDCLPDATIQERELLLSGTCQQCWDLMFPAEEDDWDLQTRNEKHFNSL